MESRQQWEPSKIKHKQALKIYKRFITTLKHHINTCDQYQSKSKSQQSGQNTKIINSYTRINKVLCSNSNSMVIQSYGLLLNGRSTNQNIPLKVIQFTNTQYTTQCITRKEKPSKSTKGNRK